MRTLYELGPGDRTPGGEVVGNMAAGRSGARVSSVNKGSAGPLNMAFRRRESAQGGDMPNAEERTGDRPTPADVDVRGPPRLTRIDEELESDRLEL